MHYGLVYMLGCWSGALITFLAIAIVRVGKEADAHQIGPARMGNATGRWPGRMTPPRGRAKLTVCGND